MTKRFTITEKWDDSWFWSLKPNEKLLWNYLCDKCDLAGFWEINIELAAVQTKITKRGIIGALEGLRRGYIKGEKYLWLRNFIYHQGNYPLNPKNNAHKHIISLLSRHSDFGLDFYKELDKSISPKLGADQGLISPTGKGNSNSKGKGKGNNGGSGGKDSKLHTTTSTERIVSAWQKLPLPEEKKSVTAADMLAIDRLISELASDTQEPIHEGMILEAIENYSQALKLPSSQTYKHKLYLWLKNHVSKYVSYAFDIDHHNGSKFKKGNQADSVVDQVEQLKAEGRL